MHGSCKRIPQHTPLNTQHNLLSIEEEKPCSKSSKFATGMGRASELCTILADCILLYRSFQPAHNNYVFLDNWHSDPSHKKIKEGKDVFHKATKLA